MGRLSQDIRYALRQLLKNPGFTAVAVLSLALGIGANSAVFSILDAVLIRPLPYPSAEQLVKVSTYNLKSGEVYGNASYPDFVDWSEQNRVFRKIAVYEDKAFNLAGIPQPGRVRGQVVSSDFFETLDVQPYEGRSLAADSNRQTAVLSYPLWSNSFGSDPGVIGRSITLDGYAYEVIGVMPPSFQFPDPQTEIWVGLTSARPDLREEIATRGNLGMSVVGRLAADVTWPQAQAGMTVIAGGLAQRYPASNRDLGVRLVPLREDVVRNFRPALLILMGSAALVLLIACANIGTLLLSRAAARQSEIAIRSSLGASRGRIIGQLLTESLLLALIGGTLGVLGAFFLLRVLIAWAPIDIPRISSAHIDLTVLVFTCLVSSLAGILFGLAPARQISRHDPGASLKQNARNVRERKPLTRILVVTEFAMSLVLLAAAGLLGKSLLRLYRVDPGFRADHLLTVEVHRSMSDQDKGSWIGFYQQLLARIEVLPGVESAGATLALPIEGQSWRIGFKIDGRAYGSSFEQPEAEARIISDNFFNVLKIPLLRGRYFSDHDTRDSPHVAVINEAVARTYWPNQDPIGRFLESPAFGIGRCEIVGIVANVRQNKLTDVPAPGIYVPYTQETMPWQTLVIRASNDPSVLGAAIRHEVAALDPDQPMGRIATMDQLLEASTSQQRFRAFLLGSFATIALLLSGVGIFGVMAYAVSVRTREIGVRMALGARPVDMLALIFAEGMALASVGVLLGLAGAYGVMRVLSSLLFEVSSTDPFTFAAVTVLLFSVAVLASYVPARRAMRVDPMVALRYE
jgi:putative ABC transport system permease protein